MFKVIEMSSREASHGEAANPPLSRERGTCVQISGVKRGAPRTASEWTALVKIASGETDLSPSQCARLEELGLVERRSGVPDLTQHGRLTLGLPE
jgi:hypothetical protein